jgi:uncharacterized protein (DUF433 family)
MAQETFLAPHIVARPDVRDGKPTLDTIAITVDSIAVWHERMGMSVAEIVGNYDVTPAQVHAALAFYLDHKAEIDRRIEDGEMEAARLRAQHPSRFARRAAGG